MAINTDHTSLFIVVAIFSDLVAINSSKYNRKQRSSIFSDLVAINFLKKITSEQCEIFSDLVAINSQ